MSNIDTIKEMSFASSFYPKEESEILRYIEHFNKVLDDNLKNQEILKIQAKALIVPHAGYVYSGFTANTAYRILQNTKAKRAIIIGPSHKISFDGISALISEYYQTPLGKLKIDLDYLSFLKTKMNIGYHKDIHKEHSTEVQMPFIKYYKKDIEILELIYSNINYNDLSKILDILLNDENNIVIISTDLSHFFTKNEAEIKDKKCIEAIKKQDINIYDTGCEACGGIGVKAIIKTSKKLNLKPKVLDYRTSFDYSKDDNSVVGYLSVAFTLWERLG